MKKHEALDQVDLAAIFAARGVNFHSHHSLIIVDTASGDQVRFSFDQGRLTHVLVSRGKDTK